jgi:hypothetical protein
MRDFAISAKNCRVIRIGLGRVVHIAKVKVKVKQSRYRPGVAQRVTGS